MLAAWRHQRGYFAAAAPDQPGVYSQELSLKRREAGPAGADSLMMDRSAFKSAGEETRHLPDLLQSAPGRSAQARVLILLWGHPIVRFTDDGTHTGTVGMA